MIKKKILVVDDEENFGKLVKLNLENTQEFEIKLETKGLRAIPAAREFKPDFILLDIVMPDLDGGEVARQLKEEKELKNIPIGFLTALVSENESLPNEKSISGHPFISKPVTVENLIAFIKKNMGNNENRG